MRIVASVRVKVLWILLSFLVMDYSILNSIVVAFKVGYQLELVIVVPTYRMDGGE